jgi:hypothetical protein
MPHRRPLATAATATLAAAMLAVGLTGGHSPFSLSDARAAQPVANEVSSESGSPGAEAVVPSGDPGVSPTPASSAAADPTAKASAHSPSGGSTGSSGVGVTSGGSSGHHDPASAPTARPTPKPTTKPTAKPTPEPTPAPTQAPVSQTGTLNVHDAAAGPALTWTQCSAANFAAYAVVRSLDSEIHYPAEDNDTVVALITSRSTTSLTDTGAPNSRVYYAVWCLSSSDGEYKTIWKTPTAVYAP